MTIIERITAQVRATSEDIRKIKDDATRMEDREYVTWVDKKGVEHGQWAEGRKFTKVTRKVQVASINPKHQRWVEYQRLKREVSILLTQKAILKALQYEDVMDPSVLVKIENLTKGDVREIIKAGFLRNHAKRPSRIAYKAARDLRRMATVEIALLPKVMA